MPTNALMWFQTFYHCICGCMLESFCLYLLYVFFVPLNSLLSRGTIQQSLIVIPFFLFFFESQGWTTCCILSSAIASYPTGMKCRAYIKKQVITLLYPMRVQNLQIAQQYLFLGNVNAGLWWDEPSQRCIKASAKRRAWASQRVLLPR